MPHKLIRAILKIMGLVIIPFLFMAFIAFFFAFVMIIKSIVIKDISPKDCLFGIGVSMIIYSILFLDYYLSKSAYALGTYFMFPLFMILLPFTFGIATRYINQMKIRTLSKISLLSVIFSGVFILICNKYTFGIIDYLKITKSF